MASDRGSPDADPRDNQDERRIGPRNRLTGREEEVLELIAEGRSNKEIARALCITPDTAKAHVSRLIHKLGLESRTQLAVAWTSMRGVSRE